jgi:transcription antitermination factor NusG
MNSEQDELEDIIAQLQQLQIQESNLILRLERLNRSGDRRPSNSPNTPREFSIGDSVRIINPRPLQAKKGIITKINTSTDRITVEAKNGSKIIRASHNIVHLE